MSRLPLFLRSGRVAFLLALCVPASDAAEHPGTRHMADRLENIAREAKPENNPFLSAERVHLFAAKLAERLRNPDEHPSLLADARGKYATELLQAGRSAEAI